MDTYDDSVHTEAQEHMEAAETMAQDSMASMDPIDLAAMQPAQERSACPDVYVVQPGDTYYDIAGKLGITAYELSELNPYVDPEALEIGQYLCIPLQTDDGELLPTAAAAREPVVVLEQEEQVVPYALDRSFVTPVPPIGTLPPVTPVPPIATLPITRPPVVIPVPPIATLPTVQTCPANHTRTTVQSGWDSSTVQRRFNVSYKALADANPRVNIDSLRVGQALCVPPSGSRGLCEDGNSFTHIVERSDTLDSIARRYRTSVPSLLRINPNLAPNDFVAGRVICVPSCC